MPAKGASSKPFELIAGHAALDFVNTLDDRFAEGGPAERLAGYDDLSRFVRQAEVMTERQYRELKTLAVSSEARSAVLAEALRLREALAAVLYAALEKREPAKDALKELEALLKRAADERSLTRSSSAGGASSLELHWEYKNVARKIQAPVWLLAQAAEDLLTSPQAAHVRRCASSTCQWLFLDTSKNHTRRWCDMKICGNRNKVRRFQLRQSAG